MNHSQQLANRFREVLLNGEWVANTNFKEQLESLDWHIAITPYRSLNSISVLAQHIHYYIVGVANVLKGGNLDIKDAYSFDFPPIESQEQWQAFLLKFWNDSEAFAILIAQLDSTTLQQPFVLEKYGSYQRNIDGMIAHCYYHLGQVVLLKKLLSNKEKTTF